ncbi:calmodulin-interacting protein 111-like [Cornus florida]|uniref:calmodulin-interacting protein 111-like n=1 Tax=Cornus florida TaxID=4283 RepID=UPI00289BD4A9|nr:calmodulin-interacting protein 111-like [Cornus florida]XP_059648425.1 calmodulin-interacting protein 111-like [Cornus florida]XP_059648433.1 calmodulin-interacting protein 111-like [Cornus florida]XP_059648441.1 calmodulin-interacting protein 111-like [Cornus florida]XP_059648450.1 calmodulin-interacting protein 111-like [Cornus florida]
MSLDSFDIREVLGDENAKKLIQTCATSWLYSRTLLFGNIVTIPILSKLCILQVVAVNAVSANNTNQDLTDESKFDMFFRAPDIIDHVNDAFFIDHETKVYICSPPHSALATPHNKDSQCVELECKDIKANMDLLKLGGLSKEYAILKDIISSSGKCTLSRFGLRPTKGVLLHGPPGTGKTSLARLCGLDAGVNLFSVNGPEIVSQYYGESEQALHEVFNSASRAAPAVVRFLP